MNGSALLLSEKLKKFGAVSVRPLMLLGPITPGNGPRLQGWGIAKQRPGPDGAKQEAGEGKISSV
ncbi:hypothetical protein N7532_008280 [Penicillium argentinense]|uniref:Uncharacterized protein n=1 Tax=Penicillium argentinense TaxID=1131581 RepID=A0A9W9K1V4_9EURO|nr:uncharacterized protein N7532_008280 [Penicillium argentinense]KAJ5089596.1 hypothetical protein N7532_008280 [Penicillium argentinense]